MSACAECPADTGEFERLAKDDPLQWTRSRLKLNPLSLAPLLFKSRNGWDLQTIVPSTRVPSLTQAEAGIRGSKAVRLYGRLVYELLSGRPPTRAGSSQRYVPLSELDQTANETLRRACADADDTYGNCQEFWGVLKDNLIAKSKERISPPFQPPPPEPLPSKPSVPSPKKHLRLVVVGAILAGAVIIVLTFFATRSGPHPSPTPSPSPLRTVTASPTNTPRGLTLEDATNEHPWENSLGMRFMPVLGTEVFFSIWDTRVQDYATFVGQTNYAAGTDWNLPDLSHDEINPVVYVSSIDAKAFCGWLTKTEHASGRLPQNKAYRLPTDEEWSAAVGLARESGHTPKEKDGKILGVYPWGNEFPPPATAGCYYITRSDSASPCRVGSFEANRFGLYDMGGNVWQWCEDWYDIPERFRVLRGASWRSSYPDSLLSSCRAFADPGVRFDYIGFRCVVASASPQ